MPSPKFLEDLLDPNALPGNLAPPSTEAVATLGEVKTPEAPVVSAEPAPAVAPMPRITPRKPVAPASGTTGIPALDAMRAQFDVLEAQLRQSPMAQLSSQVGALAAQLNRIEAALGSVSKLSAALTIRLDEVGLAVERIEESQERMAKQELSGLPFLRSLRIQKAPEPLPVATFVEPTATAEHMAKPPDLLDQVLALDWGGPVSWEIRTIGGLYRPTATLVQALAAIAGLAFPSSLRAVRGSPIDADVTRQVSAVGTEEGILGGLIQLHADPAWQLRSIADAPSPKDYKLGTLHAYRAAAERTCPSCGAVPGYACRKVTKLGKILDVACENPHPTRRKAAVAGDPTPEVNDGN